jgi:DNA repair exonuclease SbcCD nuclease subunit
MSEFEDVVLDSAGLLDSFTYVALGHIHKPQCLDGKSHIRYSGSVERMDLGEKGDTKSVVLFDVASSGLSGEPKVLPMEATAIYEVDVRSPAEELPALRKRYADAKEDLVNIHLVYTAGKDNLEDVLDQLEAIFPRWYSRDWTETGALGPTLVGEGETAAKGFAETVREYFDQELTNHSEQDRAAIIERLEALFREIEA